MHFIVEKIKYFTFFALERNLARDKTAFLVLKVIKVMKHLPKE